MTCTNLVKRASPSGDEEGVGDRKERTRCAVLTLAANTPTCKDYDALKKRLRMKEEEAGPAVECFKSLFSDKKKNKDILRFLKERGCFPDDDATNAHEVLTNSGFWCSSSNHNGKNNTEPCTDKLSPGCKHLTQSDASVFSQLIKGLVYWLDSIMVRAENKSKQKLIDAKSRLDRGTKTEIWTLPHEVVLGSKTVREAYPRSWSWI